MPVYDYQCDQCQTRFEIQASFHEKEIGLKPECPKCRSSKTHQLLSTGIFVNSGSDDRGSIPPSFCGPSSGLGCCGG